MDSLSSHLLLPHILQPKRVRRNSKTPIDNIFSNAISSNIIPDNITSSISLKNAAIKLNKAKAVLTKIRHRVDMTTLKSIYHAIFELHLCYAALVWTYNSSSDRRLYILQKQPLRLMLFQNRNTHACPLFKTSKVLKFSDKIALENLMLVRKSLSKSLPKTLCDWFTLPFESHAHNSKWANNGRINVPFHYTKTCGRYSVTVNAIYIWNFLQSQHQGTLLYLLKTKQLYEY